MKTGINIGPSSEAVNRVVASLKAIMACGEDKPNQETIQLAIRSFTQVCRVSHTTITGCTLTDNTGGRRK